VVTSNLVELKQVLKTGDIIMHYGDDIIARMIHKFNDTQYNHCSIYDKDGYLYESVSGGVQRKKIEESVCVQKSHELTILRLKDSKEDLDDVIKIIKEEYLHEESYAISQILLLFLLSLKKYYLEKDSSFIKKYTYKKMIYSCHFLEKIFDPNNSRHLCTELIYRAYEEAAITKNKKQLHLQVPIETSFLSFSKDFKIFFNRNRKLKNKNYSNLSIHDLQDTNPEEYEIFKRIEFSNFITPKDLEFTKNLEKIIVYKKGVNFDQNFCA